MNGERVASVRRSSAPDPLAPFAGYVRARFTDDPHLWAAALFDEVVQLGYGGSYVSFARQVRLAGLRPHCEACSGVKGRETIEIDHPAGDSVEQVHRMRRSVSNQTERDVACDRAGAKLVGDRLPQHRHPRPGHALSRTDRDAVQVSGRVGVG